MNKIDVHPCTQVDFPHLLPMLEAYSEVFDYLFKRQIIQTAQKVLDEMSSTPTIFMAHHEGSAVGFIGFSRDDEDPSRFELFGQVVKRGYQGQGIGSQMLAYTSQYNTSIGAAEIHVLLRAHVPPPTRHFYVKNGFKPSFNDEYRGASAEDVMLTKALKHQLATQASMYAV